VFGYFAPWWKQGAVVAVYIAAESVLGLAPAVVFRALIDYLGRPNANLGHVLLLVEAGIGAASCDYLANVNSRLRFRVAIPWAAQLDSDPVRRSLNGCRATACGAISRRAAPWWSGPLRPAAISAGRGRPMATGDGLPC